MLKAFRDNLKYLSWILWIVIAAFVLFLAVEIPQAPTQGQPTQAAATVGDREISYGELQSAYQQEEQNLRQSYGDQFTPELARQMQLPLRVLERLIQESILLEEAERMGLTVTDSELQKTLLSYPIFQDASGNFVGTDDYVQILRNQGLGTPEDFEEQIRYSLLLNKFQTVMGQNIVVTDADVEASYRETAEQAKIRYLAVPVSQFRDEAEVDAAQLDAYFQANIEEFRLPERRTIDYLVVDSDVIRQGLDISDDELETYYRENSADYSLEEQVRARHILLRTGPDRSPEQAAAELEGARARVAAGEDFGDLAIELSDDTTTAAMGGDLGMFGRGQILPEVEEAAFGAQAGDIVGPIQSAFGAHLIQVQEHTTGGLPPFEQMKDAVSRRVTSQRARESAQARADELADRLDREDMDTAAMEELAAADPSLSLQTTPSFGRTDNVAGIGRSTPFSATAFGLQPGGTSQPVQVGANLAILRLSDIEEPRLPELAEVEADVRARVKEIQAEEAALERLRTTSQTVVDGSSLEAVAEDLAATVVESELVSRGQSLGGSLGAGTEVVEAALAMEQGQVGEPILVGGQAVLFEVAERQHFDALKFAEEKEAVRDQLAGQRLVELLSTLVAERREELEVSYDPGLSQNLGLDQG